jgi:hypothetical protein
MDLSGNDVIPINQFILGSFDNLSNQENDCHNYFVLPDINEDENEEENDIIEIEFSKNNEGLTIEFINYFDENTLNISNISEHGMEKYTLSLKFGEIFFFGVKIGFDKNYSNLANANYLLRYYYKIEKQNLTYNFDKTPNIDEIPQTEEEKEKIFTFQFGKLFSNITKSTVFYNLYLDENITEILNTSAIVSTKPICGEVVSDDNNQEDSIKFNISLDSSSFTKYKFIIQIRIIVYNQQDLEFLAYSIPVDLTKFFEKKNNNHNDNNDMPENPSKFIIRAIIIIIIVILCLAFSLIVCKYINERKKNSNLTEQVLSMSFSSGQDLTVFNDGSHTAEKDKDYETTFI